MRLLLPLAGLLGLAGLLLTGCIMPEAAPFSAGTASPFDPNADPRYPWTDVPEIVSGVCFEAGWDAVGQVFVLRNEADLLRFYDLVDNSQLCRRPVRRVSFDFSNGRALVGLWSMQLLPPYLLWKRLPPAYWSHPALAAATVLGVASLLITLDGLLNAFEIQAFTAGAGGVAQLLGTKEGRRLWQA